MQAAQMSDALAEARATLEAAVQAEREAGQDVEWYRKNKAPRGKIREEEERHAAATRAVAEARRRVEALQEAEEFSRTAAGQSEELVEEFNDHYTWILEALTEAGRRYGRMKSAWIKRENLDSGFREAQALLGEKGHFLPGEPKVHINRAESGGRFLIRLVERSISGYLGDTLMQLTKE